MQMGKIQQLQMGLKQQEMQMGAMSQPPQQTGLPGGNAGQQIMAPNSAPMQQIQNQQTGQLPQAAGVVQ